MTQRTITPAAAAAAAAAALAVLDHITTSFKKICQTFRPGFCFYLFLFRLDRKTGFSVGNCSATGCKNAEVGQLSCGFIFLD